MRAVDTKWRMAIAAALLLLLGLLPRPALALSCWVDGGVENLDFGRFAVADGRVTASTEVRVGCSAASESEFNRPILVCLAMAPGSTSPREMSMNWPAGRRLRYDVYADSAHAQVLGVQPRAFGYVSVQNWGGGRGRFMLYGQLDGTQSGIVAGDYYEYQVNGRMGWTDVPGATCDNVVLDRTFQFQARASLTSSCSVVANDLAFGSHGGLRTAITGSTSVAVQCTEGTPYTVRLDGGSSGDIGNRRMRRNGIGPQSIGYGLYTDAQRTQTWGDGKRGGATVPGSGNGLVQTYTVHGRVPVQADVPAGTYTDVVTATVEY